MSTPENALNKIPGNLSYQNSFRKLHLQTPHPCCSRNNTYLWPTSTSYDSNKELDPLLIDLKIKSSADPASSNPFSSDHRLQTQLRT